MHIEKTSQNDAVTVALTGRLDTVTAPEFEQVIASALDEASSLTLDLKGLEYVSSAGLRVILSAQKAMKAKGGMKLINVGEAVMDVFEITGFTDILTIE